MPQPPAGRDGSVAERVMRWQRSHGRHGLPWQGTRDPYRVWLSEIMLQQTQVTTVLAYYTRFLERFPDVVALAAAPLDDVLAAWSGLGYYSRARHLHRCAQAVVREHGGSFPRSSEGLARLPGIGPSTAAAIAAFCFGERAAILDGNVKRVLTRVLGFADDLAVAAHQQALWQLARSLLPEQGIETYTQGLMDLGATVCTARSPGCAACPLQAVCAARQEGAPQRYPVKSRRLQRGRREHALLWLEHDQRVWLLQRPAQGVWAQLWSLPELETMADLQRLVQEWPGEGGALPAVRHALTHFDWRLLPYRHRLPAAMPGARMAGVEHALQAALGAGRWFRHDEALALGLPAPVRKLLASASQPPVLAGAC